MTIEIICVGKIKEKFFRDAIDEYKKRLSRFCKLQITEVNDISIPDHASEAEEKIVLQKEGESIILKLKKDSYVIALCVEGIQMSTETFSGKLQQLSISGKSHVTFIIGGSLGLSCDVKHCADFSFSLSPLTLTHNMARLFLLEQVYRSFKIIHGEAYHK